MSKYSVTIAAFPEKDFDEVILSGGNQTARLAPAMGNNLFSYVKDGQELLATTDFNGRMGGFGLPVMFPYANRIQDATFQFGDCRYTVIKNGQPKIMHGIVQDEAFNIDESGADDTRAYVTCSIEFTPGGPLYPIFPFYLKLSMTYSISAEGLRLDWSVENKDDKAAPFGFGVHTFFNKIDPEHDTIVHVPNRMMMETVECFPTRRILDTQGTTWDLSMGRRLSEMNFDNLFGNMSSSCPSFIDYTKSGLRTTLTASDDMKYMVIFTPPRMKTGFCLENQTNATDGFNMYAEGKKDLSNVLILQPGETHCGWIRIENEKI